MKWVLDAHAMQGSVKQALMVRILSLPMPKGFKEVLHKIVRNLKIVSLDSSDEVLD